MNNEETSVIVIKVESSDTLVSECKDIIDKEAEYSQEYVEELQTAQSKIDKYINKYVGKRIKEYLNGSSYNLTTHIYIIIDGELGRAKEEFYNELKRVLSPIEKKHITR